MPEVFDGLFHLNCDSCFFELAITRNSSYLGLLSTWSQLSMEKSKFSKNQTLLIRNLHLVRNFLELKANNQFWACFNSTKGLFSIKKTRTEYHKNLFKKTLSSHLQFHSKKSQGYSNQTTLNLHRANCIQAMNFFLRISNFAI